MTSDASKNLLVERDIPNFEWLAMKFTAEANHPDAAFSFETMTGEDGKPELGVIDAYRDEPMPAVVWFQKLDELMENRKRYHTSLQVSKLILQTLPAEGGNG